MALTSYAVVPLGEQWIETNDEGESLDYRDGKIYLTPQH
jgi:hypothetical protein